MLQRDTGQFFTLVAWLQYASVSSRENAIFGPQSEREWVTQQRVKVTWQKVSQNH